MEKLFERIKVNERLKNPVFWVQVIGAGILAALGYNSLEPQSLTTWCSLWNLIKGVFANPYLLAIVIWNVWSAYNNPKTRGLTDKGDPINS